MPRPMIRIIDGDKVIDREMNDAEFAQLQIDQAEAASRIAEAEAKATARASALAKLAAIGLSADEIASL